MPTDRPRPQHDLLSRLTTQSTWDDYYAAHFKTDDLTPPHSELCVLCGCTVRDGWQVDHVDRLHSWSRF